MGKKATAYLLDVLIFVATVACAVLSIIGSFADKLSPSDSWFVTIIALGMLPLIICDILFSLYWIVRRRWWFVISIAGILFNLEFMSATFRIRFSKPKEFYDVKVSTYNIFGFRTGNSRATAENIAYFLVQENVDIACFQEFAPYTKELRDSICKLFNFMPYAATPLNAEDKYSMAIFSKFPIIRYQFFDFPETDNAAMWADIEINGQLVRVFNNHFQTTNINQSKREISRIKNEKLQEGGKEAIDIVRERLRHNFIKRQQQAEKMRSVIDTTTLPIILCGDFNDTPASYTYHTVKGEELHDCFTEAGRGYAFSYRSMKGILRIDFVMCNDNVSCVEYYSPNLTWSDHKPVLAGFVFR